MNRFGVNFVACLVALPAAAQTIEVRIEAVRSDKGQLFVSLVDTAQKKVERHIVAAAAGAVTVDFTGVAPGDYAIKVYHDENMNGRMDKNFLGLPTEGYAFSNRARARFGPPSFASMRIVVTAVAATQTVAVMRY